MGPSNSVFSVLSTVYTYLHLEIKEIGSVTEHRIPFDHVMSQSNFVEIKMANKFYNQSEFLLKLTCCQKNTLIHLVVVVVGKSRHSQP